MFNCLHRETTKCVIEAISDIPSDRHEDFLEKCLDDLSRKNRKFINLNKNLFQLN